VKLLHKLGAVTALACAMQAGAAPFSDVLDTPSMPSPLAAKTLLQSVAHAGPRLVAVGQRGHIVVSDDAGGTWKQSPSPVSSDLTSVFFADARAGWAVGHDGVILHSGDGGGTWQVQLTGREACDTMVTALERAAAAPALREEAARCRQQGPDKPFLDVWFSDARTGFAVGAYNLIFHTRDGGETWESWFDRSDNPRFLNLHAIRPAGGSLYIAGEAGLLMRLDGATQRFVPVPVPYKGSFFGVADAQGCVVAFGLRGNVWGSDDGHAWSHVDAGLAAAVVAATRMPGGRLVLADAGGRVAVSSGVGCGFARVELRPSVPVAGIAAASASELVLAGPRGAVLARLVK
jgi:photosystem II stability/assembly factor-like uncharacterized protein